MPPLDFHFDRQQLRPRKSGPTLRLIKRVWTKPLSPGTRLELLGPNDRVLDEEIIHLNHPFPMAIGFWIPPTAKRLRLRIVSPGKSSSSIHEVRLRGDASVAIPLSPMRDLDGYLRRRERASDRWPGVARFDVARHLRRHSIVYEKPARHWTEGLYLGNGTVGGVVTGDLSGIFRLGLDHVKIWIADHQDRPLGRGYAADLTLSYGGRRNARRNTFRQVLDIGEGRVHTRDGPIQIDCRIDHETSLVHVRLSSSRSQRVDIRLSRRELPLVATPLAAVWNGSWLRILSDEALEKVRKEFADAPRAPIVTRSSKKTGALICRAPNLSIVTTLHAPVPVMARPRDNDLIATLNLKPNRPQTIVLSVDVCRKNEEAMRPLDRVQTGKVSLDRHRRSWQRFWNHSFLQLHDPLQESLYYQGLYHLRCTFAGNDSPSFFGMTQPVDHRTWLDGHTTDAQTEMLQWGTLATNHLATAAPLLNAYARAWIEHAEHTQSKGTKVPHMFYPAEGGGHGSLAPPARHPYPFGSTAWHALDFWWDFLYSQDMRFLRDIAYPILRSAAESIAQTMTWRDGHFHCLDSTSPEQEKTADDNVYDRVCVQALLEATIRAATLLRVDRIERNRFTRVLRCLYPLATDERTLFECAANHHPYRCHPVVLMGLTPLALWPPGTREYELANRTFDVVTNLYGFHYEDRHRTIVGHEGGVEPNGHATSFLLGAAARLRRSEDFDRLFNALVVGRQLKRNGLRAICDPRHCVELERMAIIEASSGQTAALAEQVLHSWSDRIDVFPCARPDRPQRFAGLRAAGGFVVSGEWTGQRVRFVAVHSLVNGSLNLTAPWEKGKTVWVRRTNRSRVTATRFPLRVRRGETIILSDNRSDLRLHRWTFPNAPDAKPTAIPISTTDPHTPDVLFYPEDLPHGQESEAGHLFLGHPSSLPHHAPFLFDQASALRKAASVDPRERQTAARVLGRFSSAAARKSLHKLALDADVATAATAVASFVRHASTASDRVVHALFDRLPPYVRGEADKAIRRRRAILKLNFA